MRRGDTSAGLEELEEHKVMVKFSRDTREILSREIKQCLKVGKK